MKKKIHILTEGFVTPNGRAFLYPIIRNRKKLQALGLDVRMFSQIKRDVADCDCLILESKFFRNFWGEDVLADTDVLLEGFKTRADRVVFFDLTDSAGFIVGPALKHVDQYLKGQVLKDRDAYLAPLYGRRAYTDYYHRVEGINDEKEETKPQVDNKDDLRKISVSWNSGLADYSLYGPYMMALYERLPAKILLRQPGGFCDGHKARPISVSCRMGTHYAKNTVSYQRKKIRRLLNEYLPTDKLNRVRYFKELTQSKQVLSPFGLGEITLKDFEVFICGSALVKPDMGHMETWPDFYKPDETYIKFSWDLSDLKEVVAGAQEDETRTMDIAQQGQDYYRSMLCSEQGSEEFCYRFQKICQGF